MAAPRAAPCIARKKSIETSFWAKPHAIDQMTNQTMPPTKTLCAGLSFSPEPGKGWETRDGDSLFMAVLSPSQGMVNVNSPEQEKK